MRKVVMLPVAAQDLADIVEYLAQFYESTALRQYDRIVEKIKELPRFPEKYEAYSAGQYRLAYRRMPWTAILSSMSCWRIRLKSTVFCTAAGTSSGTWIPAYRRSYLIDDHQAGARWRVCKKERLFNFGQPLFILS